VVAQHSPWLSTACRQTSVFEPKEPLGSGRHLARLLGSKVLFLEVGGHLSDKFKDVVHVLDFAIRVSLLSIEVPNNHASSSLSDDSAGVALLELRGLRHRIVVSEHVLDLTKTDACFRRAPVSFGGLLRTVDLVDNKLGFRAIHLLNFDFSRLRKNRSISSNGPLCAIKAIDGRAVTHVLDGPNVRVVVEPVHHLVGVRVPVAHLLFLLRKIN
jgi:hypothetical protein